jgi:hypothetical protein
LLPLILPATSTYVGDHSGVHHSHEGPAGAYGADFLEATTDGLDDRDFAAGARQPAVRQILDKYRTGGTVTDASAVLFEGCTTARDCSR